MDEINEIREFLAETDWIPLRVAAGEADVSEYSDILEARKIARAEISAHDGEDKNAKKLKEKALKIKASKADKEKKNKG